MLIIQYIIFWMYLNLVLSQGFLDGSLPMCMNRTSTKPVHDKGDVPAFGMSNQLPFWACQHCNRMLPLWGLVPRRQTLTRFTDIGGGNLFSQNQLMEGLKLFHMMKQKWVAYMWCNCIQEFKSHVNNMKWSHHMSEDPFGREISSQVLQLILGFIAVFKIKTKYNAQK